MMENRTDETLDQMLAKLPREIAVPGNLWPGIERGMKRRPRSVGSFAFAASIAVFSIVGALTWTILHERAQQRIDSRSTSSATLRFNEPRDPGYLAARAELEKSFRERLATLEPHTRAKIEANLALIRQAHEEIRRALDAEPANPVLEHLLESTWHEEFDLYDNVVRGTQPNLLRI
jgi:hypothetical protein